MKVSKFILLGGKAVKSITLAIIIGITAISLLFSCNKGPVEPERPLVGNWTWRQSCGGFAFHCEYADSVDYSKNISFGYNNDFTEQRNDSLLFSGRYRIIRKPVWGNDTSDVVVIDGYHTELTIEYLRNDSLSLVDNCLDCFSSLYLRLGDI